MKTKSAWGKVFSSPSLLCSADIGHTGLEAVRDLKEIYGMTVSLLRGWLFWGAAVLMRSCFCSSLPSVLHISLTWSLCGHLIRIERWCQPQVFIFLFKFMHKIRIVFHLSEKNIFFSKEARTIVRWEASLQKCFTEIKRILQNPFTYRAILGIYSQILQNAEWSQNSTCLKSGWN